MKLTELKPRWFDIPGVGGEKDGVTFECPGSCCAGKASRVRLAVQFSNPIGTEPKPMMTHKEKLRHVHDLRTFDVPPGFLWHRTGETFDDLTISPSVDASAAGHWHGFVVGGDVR